MALKDDWKNTGKGLGAAFKGLGKTVVRSVKTGVDKVDDAAEGKNDSPDSNVFNDGSWRETGKELGGAFKGLGKSILDSAKAGIDALENTCDNNTAHSSDDSAGESSESDNKGE